MRRKLSPFSPPLLAALAAALAIPLALAGCASGTSGPGSGGGGADAASVSIVASTNVYGDIARTIAGDSATVTSLIDDPDRDPHEYEATGRNQLAISKANIVIENGGGYDAFVDRMLHSAGRDDVVVLNVATLSGRDQHPAEGEFNEHLWYDMPSMAKLATALADALVKAKPADADALHANERDFLASLASLEKREAALKEAHGGAAVAITEPVSLYMLEAAGLVNRTPKAFSEGIEEDSDVAPSVLRDMLALFDDRTVAALIYNAQTEGPQTEAVLEAAKKNGIPRVPVTETMPAGTHYSAWMRHNLDAIGSALGGGR
ncbi:zinc ABC transporter substrate-binding protein [Microbacterium sp. STN6]|uniref:metal ABC transporter solute-binding protein, Zn/Mn family n=1 Tax=Microbacterium sp. STN6 TaxID=2995588 RepID=UPI002260B372|nr:zinc ABC transporter substrate-binding protein [Microbacterium sp. STN6]MCX7522805.1 zinc ABC transporter substrate-binding protein [Microbacterium sp. STN6]